MGFYNAYAGVTLPNPGSVGLHESMGFTPVGVYREVGYKFGKWHNVGWWEMELQPKLNNPAPPMLLPQAIASAGWNEALSAGIPLLKVSLPG
jgi:phosphinothricin acetyltransferase